MTSHVYLRLVMNNSTSDQVQRALVHVGPLLNDLLLDFQGFFAKTILGTHGRELFNESKSKIKNYGLRKVKKQRGVQLFWSSFCVSNLKHKKIFYKLVYSIWSRDNNSFDFC